MKSLLSYRMALDAIWIWPNLLRVTFWYTFILRQKSLIEHYKRHYNITLMKMNPLLLQYW